MHISVYTSIPIAQFITPPPPPPCHFPTLVSIRLFSTSVSQLLPCKPVHLNHFSRFHIHAVFYFLTRFLISESTFSQLIQLFFGLVLHEFIDLTKLESFLRLSSRTHTHTHTHIHFSKYLQQTLGYIRTTSLCCLGQGWGSPLSPSKNPDRICWSISETSKQKPQPYKHRCSSKENWVSYVKLSVSTEIQGIW